jgi:hypothetical protein
MERNIRSSRRQEILRFAQNNGFKLLIATSLSFDRLNHEGGVRKVFGSRSSARRSIKDVFPPSSFLLKERILLKKSNIRYDVEL